MRRILSLRVFPLCRQHQIPPTKNEVKSQMVAEAGWDLEKTTMIYEEPAVKQVFERLDRTSERGERRRKAGERSAEVWRLSVKASEHNKMSLGRKRELMIFHILQDLW